MVSKIFATLVSLILLLFSFAPALAQQSNGSIPERNGDYPDPEHPGIRVRVFVHEAGKPQASTASCMDGSSDALVGKTGWKLPSGTWTYNLNPSSVPSSVGGGNLPTIATNAFNQWQGAQSKVTFSKGADTTATRNALDGQNIVAWGRTSGTALAVTYTRYYTSTGIVADVDTIFNVKFPWSWTVYQQNLCVSTNAYDTQDILTHETGHWMGLDDEYATNYQDNTMYGYGSKNEIKKDTLTTGDINGVKAIY